MTNHQHIINVDPDVRGIARLFLETYGPSMRDVKLTLDAYHNREGIGELREMCQTLENMLSAPKIDIVPLHMGVRLLGSLIRDENAEVVRGRERMTKKHAVQHYSERKQKPKYEFNTKDWERIRNYQEDKKVSYEDNKDQAELCKMMQKDLIHLLHVMGVPPRNVPPGNTLEQPHL